MERVLGLDLDLEVDGILCEPRIRSRLVLYVYYVISGVEDARIKQLVPTTPEVH